MSRSDKNQSCSNTFEGFVKTDFDGFFILLTLFG